MKKNPATLCKCSKCEIEIVSIPGKRHRNCSGEAGKPPKNQFERLVVADRGKWLPLGLEEE